MATGSEEVTFFPLAADCMVSVEAPEVLPLEPVYGVLPPLFDAPLFCLTSHAPDMIRGSFLPYRYYHASLQEKRIGIHPLGVSGVTVAEGNVLIGIRSHTALWKRYTECVPSGGIEEQAAESGKIDYYQQLLWELEEEAGIVPSLVKRHTLIGLFYSARDGVYDLGIVLELEKVVPTQGSKEYTSLEWMPFSAWEAMLQRPDAHIVPLSRALWREAAGTSRW